MEEETPDLILLQLGTNDVRMDHDSTTVDVFQSNMEKIVRIFQGFKNRFGKKSRLLLGKIPPIPEGNPYPFSRESAERVTVDINPIIKKLAAQEKLILVDNYNLFLQAPHLLPEVHPSLEGYKHLAQNWYDSFQHFLSNPSANPIVEEEQEIKTDFPFMGKIVFQSNMDGDDEIYALHQDGLEKLTDNDWEDRYPRWSPDGNRIAFHSNVNGNFDIFVMKEDGTDKTQQTFSKRDEVDASWFPDGKKIAYSVEKKGILRRRSTLFVIDLQSKSIKRLIPDFENTHAIATVSPKNPDLITFTGKRTIGWDAAIYNRKKNTVEFLEEKGESCRGRFSNDGKKIAYVSSRLDGKGDIWLMNPDGSEKTRLTERDKMHDYFPSWSPDDKYIAFNSSTQHSHEGDWALLVLEVSTKKIFPLFDSPGNDTFPDWKK
jgi:dipeptidyl aminopeptidase/acylaminoacyl peptidase